MKVWSSGIFVAALIFSTMTVQSQIPTAVKFEFERSGLELPHWRMTIDASGEGLYEELPAGDAAPMKQTVHLSTAVLKRLHAGATQAATKSCETRLKNIANTGKKTITYLSGSGDTLGGCTYNLADDPGLRDTTVAFLDIQETLRAGQRLAFKHRFDRLGLDAEIDTLVAMVKSRDAIELRNIVPVLESIAADDQVLKRVREKAMTLLQQAQVEG